MGNYTIRLNVEGNRIIDFEVKKETFEKFSKICQKRFPDKNWKIS